jgi:hypothetical protein
MPAPCRGTPSNRRPTLFSAFSDDGMVVRPNVCDSKGDASVAKTGEHGQLIAAAAKAALLPLGCVRKGQSRVWYSDQRYWLIAVEFQPSGWSKGSYLNIFVDWLWNVTSGYSINYRPFIPPFVNADQFTPRIAAELAAQIAAVEVLKLRKRFESFKNIHEHLIKQARRDGRHVYNAAIASGLIEDLPSAHVFFEEMAATETHGSDWQEKLKRDSATLAAVVDEPAAFRATILDLIGQRRQLQRLPTDPDCLDALDAKEAPSTQLVRRRHIGTVTAVLWRD